MEAVGGAGAPCGHVRRHARVGSLRAVVRRCERRGHPDRTVLVQGPLRTAEDAKKSEDCRRSGRDLGTAQFLDWAVSCERAEGLRFPSTTLVTPIWPESVLRNYVRPKLRPAQLGWINFAVLRRSHSTLHKQRNSDLKIIADQQGHGMRTHLDNVATAKSLAATPGFARGARPCIARVYARESKVCNIRRAC